MKKLNLLFGLVLSFAVIVMFTACNNSGESADTSEEVVENDDDETTESDDKSQRPSPPAVAEGKIGETNVMIDYSQPAVKGRAIWGDLVPYGSVWRTGANEATTIEFSQAAKVNGKEIPAGKYSLFTIPGEKEWTFIFNSVDKQWGAYEYDESKDVLRVTATPEETETASERMTFAVNEDGFDLMWDKLKVGVTVE